MLPGCILMTGDVFLLCNLTFFLIVPRTSGWWAEHKNGTCFWRIPSGRISGLCGQGIIYLQMSHLVGYLVTHMQLKKDLGRIRDWRVPVWLTPSFFLLSLLHLQFRTKSLLLIFLLPTLLGFYASGRCQRTLMFFCILRLSSFHNYKSRSSFETSLEEFIFSSSRIENLVPIWVF